MRIRALSLVACALAAGCKGKQPNREAAPSPPAASDARLAIPVDTMPILRDAAVRAARVEHTVWKLVDNRHTAHRTVDAESVLDAGSLGFARFTRFGIPATTWKLGTQVAGTRAAIADKLAHIELPLTADQLTPVQITASVHAEDDKSALEIRVNGSKPAKRARVSLEAGWQTVAVPIEPNAVVAGENVISLERIGKTKSKLALAWLRIGPSHPLATEQPLETAVFDPDADAIGLSSRATLTWYVTLPEGAQLVAEVAAPCLVEVGARAGDASFAGGLLGGDSDRVDLSAMAGKTVRLSLATRDCPQARISHPRITVHGPEPIGLPVAEPPRYVIVWITAGLRAAIGFDELAKASVVFRQFAWTTSDLTGLGVPLAKSGVDGMLARFDQHRDKPFVMLADTSGEPDAQIPRVVAQLKSWGIWDQTLLMVIGGSGDGLVIHDPPRFPAGTIVDDGADGVDLVPTVRAALGQPVSSEAHGMSLASLAQGIGRGWPRPSYVPVDESTHAMRIGQWAIRAGGGPVPIVIDAVNDPGEAVDLALVRPFERRMLTDALGLLLPLRSRWRKAEWGVVSNLSAAGARAIDDAVARD
jgi:hypothetical protein